MEVLEVNETLKTVKIKWNNQIREFPYIPTSTGLFTIPVAGRVGASGVKLWRGYQGFYRVIDQDPVKGDVVTWRPGFVMGGLQGKPFTPVCFQDQVPEALAGKHSYIGLNIHRGLTP